MVTNQAHSAPPLDGDADIENAANALAFMIHQGIDADVIAARFPQLHKIEQHA